jgi:hypothetical protein
LTIARTIIAISARSASIGTAIAEDRLSAQYTSLCMLTVGSAGVSDPLHDSVMRRMSWRGSFVPSQEDDDSLSTIAAARDDVFCIRDRAALSEIAQWADQAELSFVRRADFRRELLDWMRLSDRHPRYLRDGLNREALSMSGLEAMGAGWVLGKLFAPLDWSGIAASMLSDQAKTSSAAGVVLFCRPRGEDPLLTGRHFYRVWLEIDRAGFAACPISALADHSGFNEKLTSSAGVGTNFRLVNVFRVGRPDKPPGSAPTLQATG